MNLEEEKKLIFAICKKPLADENPLHFEVLLTLYKLLTGSKLDCPRYGSHWEQIGFQGNDPATDLRGGSKNIFSCASKHKICSKIREQIKRHICCFMK